MSDESPTIDSLTARALAEYASSLRGPNGDPEYLVVDHPSTSGPTIHIQKDPPRDNQAHVVVHCNTKSVQRNRRAVSQVRMWPKGSITGVGLDRYDAVFWSEAAVEKFVFPYYASKGQWAAAHVLSVLSQVFYGGVPGLTGLAPGDTGLSQDEVPFAVAHLPRSDYAPVKDENQGDDEDEHGGQARPNHLLGQQLAILFYDSRTGKVRHRLLADFL